jgi:hypothetical protein
MAWKNVTYHLKSTTPLLMHSGQGADPMNKYSKMLKEISGKRGKTDEDHEAMAKIEFMSALYMGPDGPVIPQSNLEAMIIAAAKKTKDGKSAAAGMSVQGNATMIYEGPKDPEKMYLDDNFRDSRAVRVMSARIMRTRPLFKEWEADVTVMFEDTVTNKTTVDQWMTTAGNLIGLCEMRPRMGRFEVI